MKKLIIGCVLIQVLTIEPVIGYYIFMKWLQIPDNVLIFVSTAFVLSGIFQLITYGSLIVSGFKDLQINHAFLPQKDVDNFERRR